MERDIAKATQDLLDRLRHQANIPPRQTAPETPAAAVQHIYIHAPKNCVFYLSPNPRPADPNASE